MKKLSLIFFNAVCRVWLLKQKQTQYWKITTATADAVYALLLRGKNLFSSDKLVEVSVGGINVTPGIKSEIQNQKSEMATSVEPGTEVKARMGEIIVKKTDEGVSWGSVHWQFLRTSAK